MNEIIELDGEFAKRIGFTGDKFSGYLWRDGDRVLVSLIVSKLPGCGHLSTLFDSIESLGLRIAVPSPFSHMEAILKHKGFEPHYEHDDMMGDVEVWEKPSDERS